MMRFSGVAEPDDYLRVEIEAVGVLLERHVPERLDAVGTVSGRKLAQVGSECGILEGRENAVADELVERHAALASRSLDDHPRVENGVALAVFERRDDLGQRFGGVLPIAVEEDDDVEAVIDRIAAGFLIPP